MVAKAMSWDPAVVSGYSTTFPPSEFSKGWKLGGTDGVAWTDPQISSGVFGSQTGSNGFDDTIYVNSRYNIANARIETTIGLNTATGIHETEHIHRASVSANNIVLYEINFAHDGAYVDFVRWKGPKGVVIGDFVFLVATGTYSMPGGALLAGDILRTEMIGDSINAWVKRAAGGGFVLINSSPVSDTANAGHATLASGMPGGGAYREAASSAANTYKVSSWSITPL